MRGKSGFDKVKEFAEVQVVEGLGFILSVWNWKSQTSKQWSNFTEFSSGKNIALAAGGKWVEVTRQNMRGPAVQGEIMVA